MKYSTRSLESLNKSICRNCYKKVLTWDEDIYRCWLGYLKGYNRNKLIKNTRFSSPESLVYQFRKHPCYSKISRIHKRFGIVKTKIRNSPLKYPWFLGLYYADGCVKNKAQLVFGLSSHESLIENKVCRILKEILSTNAYIAKEKIGNMRQIRLSSIELCDKLPNKQDKKLFLRFWNSFNKIQKINFIAGFIDGDGSCSFDVGINSIQIYSKQIPFLLKEFYKFLFPYGYVSLINNNYKLYLSSKVGLKLKKYLVKKNIKRPYHGSVDVKKAFDLLKKGNSICKISKIFNLNKKTINLALKQIYGINLIKKYTDKNKIKRNPRYLNNRMDVYYTHLKNGKCLFWITKKYNLHHSYLKKLLIKKYGKKLIKKYIRPMRNF